MRFMPEEQSAARITHEIAYAAVRYWPGNVDVPRHGTTVPLIDQGTGRVCAAVEAGTVNAYRTAAADAVSADALARRTRRR